MATGDQAMEGGNGRDGDAAAAPATLYGISNCDTVRRARADLTARAVGHRFHDFRQHGLPADALDRWMAALGWQALVNRRGTTWRALGEAAQASVVDAGSARAALLANPSLVKRPVVEWADGRITVGYDAAAWGFGAPAPR